MNKAFEFHEYTTESLHDPDLAAYGRAGWELVAVLPYKEPFPTSYESKYTFFLQREYVLEIRQAHKMLEGSND